MASVIDLDRVRRNDDRLSTLQLILSGSVDLNALKGVLRVNTKVSEVIIYVDESFLVELPVEETRDLFNTIGGMPNLQKLGFHSQSGSSGVLSIQALIAITSHATRMVHFGISDVALWGTQADFQEWATQLQTQLFLQSFCVCECELLEPSEECPVDPLLTVLSILPSLEALFLQAATPNALGQVSPEAVGAIGMAPQLQDLRLGNFELKHGHMEQLSRVLSHNPVLTELKLDACHEFGIDTAKALAKILKNNHKMKSLELGLMVMMDDDCAHVVAQSLRHNASLESFTLSKGANARFRPTISKACQEAFVDMLQQNYALETLVLFQRFPVKKEFKLYLTLNKYGRGKLLKSHSSKREDWIQAIHKVNDDLDSIFYYISINPSLCTNCNDERKEEAVASPPEQEVEAERALAAAIAAGLDPNDPLVRILSSRVKRRREGECPPVTAPAQDATRTFLWQCQAESKRRRVVAATEAAGVTFQDQLRAASSSVEQPSVALSRAVATFQQAPRPAHAPIDQAAAVELIAPQLDHLRGGGGSAVAAAAVDSQLDLVAALRLAEQQQLARQQQQQQQLLAAELLQLQQRLQQPQQPHQLEQQLQQLQHIQQQLQVQQQIQLLQRQLEQNQQRQPAFQQLQRQALEHQPHHQQQQRQLLELELRMELQRALHHRQQLGLRQQDPPGAQFHGIF